ncbi:hypothetical protein D9619_004080 [Psilocybe cf. subviscida]|uniref:Uncharacterized protein n=1 Tax=Psilocybe cf. subviscida TaxID=2480587 RepID=A0A8H5F8K4_9AGAR|nr:hypothetical protein D9619_004080 [Psilocybe cf. subviscida]
MQGASNQLLQTYRNRKSQPPTKKTAMFTWEQVVTPGGLAVFMRKQAVRRQFEDLLDDGDPNVYDEVHNEWDIFPDFIANTSSEPEEGVPRLCMAPPRQYVPYDPDSDDEDSNGEISFEEPFNVTMSSPHPPSPLPRSLPISAAISLPVESSTMTSAQPPSPLPGPLPTPAAGSLPVDSPTMSPPRPPSPLPGPSSTPVASSLPVNSSSGDTDHRVFSRVEENIGLCTPIAQALQYNYGFTHRIIQNASTPPNLNLLDEKGVGKTLGYLTSPAPDQIDLSMKIFVSSLAQAQAPPEQLDDLNANNFTSLRDLFQFRNILRLQDGLFVFHSLSCPGYDWDIAVSSSEAALYVIRYIVSNPTHNLVTIAHRLLKFGIPFHTVIHRPTSLSSYTVATRPRYRLSNHQFTAADFDSAMLAAKALLQGPAGRVALMRGGIIGRIARQFVSEDSVFKGPSEKVRREFCGLVVDSEARGYQYWDDILTEDNLLVICGQYEVYTGNGSQTAFLTYFPLARDWDDKNGFCWLEWTDASEALFQSILTKNQAGERPKNAGNWRKVIRGFGQTRQLLDFNPSVFRRLLSAFPFPFLFQLSDVVFSRILNPSRIGQFFSYIPSMPNFRVPWYDISHSLLSIRSQKSGYNVYATLKGAQGPINSVAISEDGKLLASGGDEEVVHIWDIEEQKNIETLSDRQGRWGQVTCVKWMGSPMDAYSVCFGTGRGLLLVYTKDKDSETSHELACAHSFLLNDPVEAIEYNEYQGKLVVCSHRGKIVMYAMNKNRTLDRVWTRNLGDIENGKATVPRSVHFANGGDSVIICGLESGIIFSKAVTSGADNWSKQLKSSIGSSRLSPNGSYLLVDNLTKGFDMYAYPALSLSESFDIHRTQTCLHDGTFLEGSLMVSCGSDHGQVYIFSCRTALCLQKLRVGSKKSMIQALDAVSSDRFHILAAGTSDDKPEIIVWRKAVRAIRGRSSNQGCSLVMAVLLMNAIALIAILGLLTAKLDMAAWNTDGLQPLYQLVKPSKMVAHLKETPNVKPDTTEAPNVKTKETPNVKTKEVPNVKIASPVFKHVHSDH